MNHPKPRILIVDDQIGIRRTMTGIIGDLGLQVDAVEDGYQAIDSVNENRFDLIFLDVKMPGINGIQTFREIKKLRPDSLVVMMTGFELAELINTAFDEGAIYVVYKPFGPEQIVHLIESAHWPGQAKPPTAIGGLVAQIQDEIDRVVPDAPIARVTVSIPDAELRAMRLLAVSGPAAADTPPLCSTVSLGGKAFYSNQVQVNNARQSDQMSSKADLGLGVKSALAVPISSDSGLTLGSVTVSCYEANYFEQESIERFSELARCVGNRMVDTSLAEAEFLHGLNGAGVLAGRVSADISR